MTFEIVRFGENVTKRCLFIVQMTLFACQNVSFE
jgi:hypothetical protein